MTAAPPADGGPGARRSTSAGLLLLTAAQGLFVVSGYVLTVWVAHRFGAVTYGSYTVVVASITIVNILVTNGIPIATARAIAQRPDLARTTWLAGLRVAAPASIVVGLAALAVAIPFAHLLRGPDLASVLAIGCGAALTYATQAMFLAYLNGRHAYGRQALAQIAYAAVRLTTIVGGAAVGGLRGAITGFVLAPLIATLAAVATIRDAPPTDTAGAVEPAHPLHDLSARWFLRRSLPLIWTAGVISLLLTADLLAFKRVGTGSDVGAYAAAGQIAHVPYFLLNAATLVLLPGVAELTERVQRQRLVQRGFADAIVVLALPTALIALLGPRLMRIVFGSEFHGAGLVAPLVLTTAAVTLHSIFVAVEAGIDRLREATLLGSGTLVALVVGVLIAGRGSDASAAAWTSAAVAGVLAVLHGGVLTARLGRFVTLRCAWAVLLATALALAARAAGGSDARVIAAGLAACVVYALVALGTGLLSLHRPADSERSSGGTARPHATD